MFQSFPKKVPTFKKRIWREAPMAKLEFFPIEATYRLWLSLELLAKIKVEKGRVK